MSDDRTTPSHLVEEVAKIVMAILWKQEQWNGVGPDYDSYRVGGHWDMGGRVERYEAQATEIALAAIPIIQRSCDAEVMKWLRDMPRGIGNELRCMIAGQLADAIEAGKHRND